MLLQTITFSFFLQSHRYIRTLSTNPVHKIYDGLLSSHAKRFVAENSGRNILISYDCPSGFSELLPARRISSVDSRFVAITELQGTTITKELDVLAHATYHECNICLFTL